MALIYIVEDDENISEIEGFALKNAGHEVKHCGCADEFYKALGKKKPDLVLLDVMLPDEDGLTIIGKIRALPETKQLPVIMVTAKSTEIDKVKGLDNGADDYITKPFGIMELMSRVKALLRRSGAAPEEKQIKIGDLFIDDSRHTVYVNDEQIELTYKEYELLKYLAVNRGIVISRDSIMDRIWSTDFEGESRTLDVHIRSLRMKLKTAGELIKTVRNVGYILDLDD